MSKWGEEAEKLEEEGEGATPGGGDGEGLKTVVEERTNEAGQKVKITRQVRVYKTVRRVNKRAEERRKRWKKFGKCANSVGLEPGISSVAEPVLFILGEDARKQKELEERLKKDQMAMTVMYKSIVSEATGGPSGAAAAIWRPRFREGGGAVMPGSGPPGSSTGLGPAAAGRYVPVHLRGRPGGPGGPGAPGQAFGAESTTLRVSNLSDDTSEMDLEAMFRPYGGVQRLYLAKDKETNYSKGFAFVSFYTRRDAQAAKDGLDGKGWDYLILNVDWAEDRKPL